VPCSVTTQLRTSTELRLACPPPYCSMMVHSLSSPAVYLLPSSVCGTLFTSTGKRRSPRVQPFDATCQTRFGTRNSLLFPLQLVVHSALCPPCERQPIRPDRAERGEPRMPGEGRHSGGRTISRGDEGKCAAHRRSLDDLCCAIYWASADTRSVGGEMSLHRCAGPDYGRQVGGRPLCLPLLRQAKQWED
jgi:hypothetical protein